MSSDFESWLHQDDLSRASLGAESEEEASSVRITSYQSEWRCGYAHEHTQEAVSEGLCHLSLTPLHSRQHSCALEHYLLWSCLGLGGCAARVWPSIEKQPCTDGSAAACTVVGPPRTGECGCAH